MSKLPHRNSRSRCPFCGHNPKQVIWFAKIGADQGAKNPLPSRERATWSE